MWGWVSELLVLSFFIHVLMQLSELMNTHAFMQRFCDKHWNYKMKVTQSTLKMICPKLEKQTGNFHTESQILRYKRWHKEHSGGEASFVSILPAFWWRWYVCSYLKDRKKYKRQRGEARTETGGEQANPWDPTQSGWLDAELSGRVRW